MLPIKITELLQKLEYRTEAGELIWEYDDNESKVKLELDNFIIRLSYSFNMLEEVGQFNVVYFDKHNGKEYYFFTTQMNDDYDLVRRLFDIAQSSDLNIDF